MNTKASVAYGWGVLILAGGGSYYFAKRSINSDREERAAEQERRRQNRQRVRYADVDTTQSPRRTQPSTDGEAASKTPVADALHDAGANPSREAADGDPAPVEHARSPYEAAEPFRSRKGDRFS